MNKVIVETEELGTCPHCKGLRLKLWRKGRDRLHNLSEQTFKYSKCKDCGLTFLSFRPTENEARKFYPQDYGPYNAGREPAPAESPFRDGLIRSLAQNSLGRFLNSVNYRTDLLFKDNCTEIPERYYQPKAHGSRLLDFGCGSEAFLNWAAQRGWVGTGIDFSEATVRSVAASGHQAFLMSPAVWDQVDDESLDFVRLNHVLEHLYSTEEVLKNVKTKMKPGATIHIAVPNPRSISSRLFRSYWLGLDCPRHVVLYSPELLRKVLMNVGFLNIEIRHEVVTKDFARSLGYFMCDRGLMKHSSAVAMKDRELLHQLLYLPAKCAAAFGLSDRYHAFARKPKQ